MSHDHKLSHDAAKFLADKNYKKRARLTLTKVVKEFRRSGGTLTGQNAMDIAKLLDEAGERCPECGARKGECQDCGKRPEA